MTFDVNVTVLIVIQVENLHFCYQITVVENQVRNFSLFTILRAKIPSPLSKFVHYAPQKESGGKNLNPLSKFGLCIVYCAHQKRVSLGKTKSFQKEKLNPFSGRKTLSPVRGKPVF